MVLKGQFTQAINRFRFLPIKVLTDGLQQIQTHAPPCEMSRQKDIRPPCFHWGIKMAGYIELGRKFRAVEAGMEVDPDSIRYLSSLGLDSTMTWDDLLKKSRAVIIAEPGTGKTEEFKAVSERLRDEGKKAFFGRLEMLQGFDVGDSLDMGDSAELKEWMEGSKEAFFFFDSVDEAKLKSHTAFESAIRKISTQLRPGLNRARIFISSRVSAWQATYDLTLFSRFLPEWEQKKVISKSEDLDDAVDVWGDAHSQTAEVVDPEESGQKKEPAVFYLTPLSGEQIKLFASKKGVKEINAFLDGINRTDAMSFAERPQDLLDLIDYWLEIGKFGQHAEMLDFSIHKKMVEKSLAHDTQRPLASKDAIMGVERIAAGATLCKKDSAILPDTPASAELSKITIDPKELFPDQAPDKVKILLDRAIFDLAFYGTVRFHHRSVREYLTAQWLKRLINNEIPQREIDNLLFANCYGINVLIPSMRPVAAWLSLWIDRIRSKVKNIAPEVLIENGDPSSLPIETRISLLNSFVERYTNRKTTSISFDISMVRRLADPALEKAVNILLAKHSQNDAICTLLLEIVWQGRISGSAELAAKCALNGDLHIYNRVLGIRAVAAAGTTKQKRDLVITLMKKNSTLAPELLGELIEAFFPTAMTNAQLLRIVKETAPPDEFDTTRLKLSVDHLGSTGITEEDAIELLKGFWFLVKQEPFVERRYCDVSERYGWLIIGAIDLANRFLRDRHPYSLNPVVLGLFHSFYMRSNYRGLGSSDKKELTALAESWPEFLQRLFWYSIDVARKKQAPGEEEINKWWQVAYEVHEFWRPSNDNMELLFLDLVEKETTKDRQIVLTALFDIYKEQGRPRKMLKRIKRTVEGSKELKDILHSLLHPGPMSAGEKRRRRQQYDFERRQQIRQNQENENRRKWREAILKNAREISYLGDGRKGELLQRTVYLFNRMREKQDNHNKLGYSNWQSLEEEFSLEVARNFRDGCIAYWREYDPFTEAERRTAKTITFASMIGLSGLAMEAAQNPEWAKQLSQAEAERAARYSLFELNGFPGWFSDLQSVHPEVVEKVIKEELRWEIQESIGTHPKVLSGIRYGEGIYNNQYQEIILELLQEKEPASDIALDYSLTLVLRGELDQETTKAIFKLAQKRFESTQIQSRKYSWLIAMLSTDALKGLDALKGWLNSINGEPGKQDVMVNICAALKDNTDGRYADIDADYEKLAALGELLPMVFQYVKPEDDLRHTGVYTPGIRDKAQDAREYLLHVVMNTPGQDAYNLLIKLSTSITEPYGRDWLEAKANERAALDAEFPPWREKEVADFSLNFTRTPRAQKDLYQLALGRLDDLKRDIEHGDESEAVLLKKLEVETEVRTVFANRLRKASRSLYTIGSEEELADATRTDIRFNAPTVGQAVPVELKIADKWTINKLRERLENQLIGQYMRSSEYGIFLLVHNGTRDYWQNPTDRKKVQFLKVVELLRADITTLITKYRNVKGLEVVGIDLTVR